MHKSRPDESDILNKNIKKKLYKSSIRKYCESDIFIDEITDKSVELFNEYDEFHNNATSLTSQFKVIPSGTDRNSLIHTLNNIVFGW